MLFNYQNDYSNECNPRPSYTIIWPKYTWAYPSKEIWPTKNQVDNSGSGEQPPTLTQGTNHSLKTVCIDSAQG